MKNNISEYHYTYGIEDRNNRKIQFRREDPDNPKTVCAVVKGLMQGKWIPVSYLKGDDINVEMMSTTDKIISLMNERNGDIVNNKPDKKLSELSCIEQKNIIDNIKPVGPWRIEIYNSPNNDKYPSFEKVTRLSLFNPS